jgi:hypothetical protein
MIASIESTSSSRAPSCAHDFMALSCARGFKCGYIDTDNPEHDMNHDIHLHGYLIKVATPIALSYLDIGTRAITSHEHSSASSIV